MTIWCPKSTGGSDFSYDKWWEKIKNEQRPEGMESHQHVMKDYLLSPKIATERTQK